MADQKITQLDELTTPASEDLLAVVDDVAGTPITKKATVAKVLAILNSGWISVSGSWAYASADAPTFTITVPSGAASLYGVGDRIKLTQTTVKYFIVTAVADTVLTVYGGTDYTLTSADISAISYSHQKAPLGFPMSPAKWTVEVTSASQYTQATPTQNQWYNLNAALAITVPIGVWNVEYQCSGEVNDNAAATGNLQVTLSTANNSESDSSLTSHLYASATGATATSLYGTFFRKRTLTIASKTPYYLNFRTINTGIDNFQINGNLSLTIFTAVCAYL